MEWDGMLYTAAQLNAEGYVLGWIPEHLRGRPDAFPVGGIVPHPAGGPDHVVVRVLNPCQVALIPWDQMPGMDRLPRC